MEKERILNLDTKEVFVSDVINEEFEPNYNTEEDYAKFIYTLKNYFWDNASFYYSFDKDLEEKEKVRNILDVD